MNPLLVIKPTREKVHCWRVCLDACITAKNSPETIESEGETSYSYVSVSELFSNINTAILSQNG